MRFLVESYLPAGGTPIEVIDGRAKAAAERLGSEGADVRYLRSILVPEDEMCVLEYDAGARELVLEAARRADVTWDRVVEAVETAG